jgi:hypothetical protein
MNNMCRKTVKYDDIARKEEWSWFSVIFENRLAFFNTFALGLSQASINETCGDDQAMAVSYSFAPPSSFSPCRCLRLE